MKYRIFPAETWCPISLFLACWLVFLCGNACTAADYVDNFDDGFDPPKTTWRAEFDNNRCRLIGHQRSTLSHTGRGSELIQFEAVPQGVNLRLIHALPPTAVLDETHLSLWVKSDRSGAKLSLRLVLPHQVNTITGETPLTIDLSGDTYTKSRRWQQLQSGNLKKEIRRKISWAIDYYDTRINQQEMYIDQVALTAQSLTGPVEYTIDDLRFGPLVQATEVVRVDHRKKGRATRNPVKFRHNQLSVKEKPTFLRILPYHDEDLTDLARLRANVLWFPDLPNVEQLTNLRKRGLWAITSPPRATAPDGTLLGASTAGLAPFGKETAGILAWYLGTGIPPEEKQAISDWETQVRGADRQYRRLFIGDVAGLERSYSRSIDLLGSSQDVLHTSLNFRQYRDGLLNKRNIALPGSFLWTWIATEPSARFNAVREAAGWNPLVVEPEQIRLQLYAALQAGNRGIGYMKATSLDDTWSGAVERKLIIRQLNMELELIERWLATSAFRKIVPFKIAQRKKTIRQSGTFGGSQHAIQRRKERLRERTFHLRQKKRLRRELEATVLEPGDDSRLILLAWLEEGAQFVPGQLAAENIKITVPPLSASAVPYEVTTTSVRSLKSERVSGGLEITLEKFDQTAIILLTSNQRLKDELNRKVAKMAPLSARFSVQLAKEKLARVQLINRELILLGHALGDGDRLIAAAKTRLRQATDALKNKDFHNARILSGESMQALRILQRAHWNEAVDHAKNLSSPVSSPHTLCFQTLPDHWEMMARFGSRATAHENLLRSGDFEDVATVIAEEWEHKQRRMPELQATAQFSPHPAPNGGEYSLRLAALPKSPENIPPTILEPPVSITTPPVNVHSGQLVHISGWVRVVTGVVGNIDGVMFYDSLGGPERGLRWQNRQGWQYFDLIREVPFSGPLTLTMSLTGMGDVYFDQLRIVAVTPAKTVGDRRGRPNIAPR